MSTSSIELVQAPFFGDVVDGIVADDGTVWISPKRICESLGLSWPRQFSKLKAVRWACVAIKAIQVGRQQREVVMMPLKAVPMWLAGISPTKVKPEFRVKLERYQDEVVEVLSAWFLGISETPGLAKALAEVKERLTKLEKLNRDTLKTVRFYRERS